MTKQNEEKTTNSCWNKAGPDELIFILLERDSTAPSVIRYWCKERVSLGLNTFDDIQIKEAQAIANTIERHQWNRQQEVQNP